ncbi:MAG: TSUP family transporter, partial [Sphingomonas sp.]|nr:TSUP family transporter [Sphingomonas sp.]
MIEPWVFAALTAIAVLTGFIDAVAGGGGLVMMPALLWAGLPPINALAANKLQSMFGTSVAC